MKQIIKGLAVLLIVTPPVGIASILNFGVWTAFTILFVMILSIRWKKNAGPDQPGEPNWVWMKLKEFHENCNLAHRNLQQVQQIQQTQVNSIRPWTSLEPVPETPDRFGEPFYFNPQGPAPTRTQAPTCPTTTRKEESDPVSNNLDIPHILPYLERQPRCLKCTMPIRSERDKCTVCEERTSIPIHQ